MKKVCVLTKLSILGMLLTQCHDPSRSNLNDSSKQESLVNQLQDFSYAGFGQGLLAIQTDTAAKEIVIEAPKDCSLDASVAIQSAFDNAMKLSSDLILILPEGNYCIENAINFSGKNIVLRGEGPKKTKLIFKNQSAKLIVGGFTSGFTNTDGLWRLKQDAMIGATSVEVQDARGLRVGSDIALDMEITNEFVIEHKASPWWDDQIGKRHEIFRRQIVGVEGDTILLDTPLRYPLKMRDQAGIKVFAKHNSNLAVESLGVNNAVETVEKAWELGGKASAIQLSQCRDCWVKNVSSFGLPGKKHHLLSHGLVIDKSYRVTVDQVHMANTQHRGEGGNGYLFIIGSSNEVLVKNSSGENGRHNLTFVGRFSNSGNVIHKFKSSGGMICSSLQGDLTNRCGVGPIDTHESLAIANLFDLVEANDGFEIGNRQSKSNSVGPTGTLNTVWNMSGTGFLRSFNTGLGYVLGTAPTVLVQTSLKDPDPKAQAAAVNTETEDLVENKGSFMDIPSLYNEQLRKRRGPAK